MSVSYSLPKHGTIILLFVQPSELSIGADYIVVPVKPYRLGSNTYTRRLAAWHEPLYPRMWTMEGLFEWGSSEEIAEAFRSCV